MISLVMVGWVASLVLVGDSIAEPTPVHPGALDSLHCFFSSDLVSMYKCVIVCVLCVTTVVPQALFMATLFNNSVSSRRAQMEVEKLL